MIGMLRPSLPCQHNSALAAVTPDGSGADLEQAHCDLKWKTQGAQCRTWCRIRWSPAMRVPTHILSPMQLSSSGELELMFHGTFTTTGSTCDLLSSSYIIQLRF